MIDILRRQLGLMQNAFEGRKINAEELKELKDKFNHIAFFDLFLPLMNDFNIIGKQFVLSEEDDLSEFGVKMEWFTPKE